VLPAPEQVPGEKYEHGSRLRVYVVGVRKGFEGPQITVSRTLRPDATRDGSSVAVSNTSGSATTFVIT